MELLIQGAITLLSTILGVVVGGFITIKVYNVTNTRLLKKSHELSLLQNIKSLLSKWRSHLMEDGTKSYELEDVKNFSSVSLCAELNHLIVNFNANLSVLNPFAVDFNKLRKAELSLSLKSETIKAKLLTLSEQYNIVKVADICNFTEGAKIIDDYAGSILEISNGIDNLIAKIDKYIELELFK